MPMIVGIFLLLVMAFQVKFLSVSVFRLIQWLRRFQRFQLLLVSALLTIQVKDY